METLVASSSSSTGQYVKPDHMFQFIEQVNRTSIGKSTKIKKGQPWLDDGNIVLITKDDSTAFRVHRGVLSRQSEIFSDMFEMPQSTKAETETYDGCLVIWLHDLPIELSDLLKAIYDGPQFSNVDPKGFFYLTGVLRLSTKYFISHLRQSAIQFLLQTWPSTLKGHDDMVELALSSPTLGHDSLTYPYVHPLHVINLARETNVSIVVPSALYFLSLYSLSGLMEGDHPKLLLEHPSKPSSTLSSSDIILYTLMYQHRLNSLQSFIREFCTSRSHQPKCGTSHTSTCAKSFSKLVNQLYKSCYLRTGPLHFMLQAIQKVTAENGFCEICKEDFVTGAEKLREEMWDSLPTVAQLPPWERIED